MTPDRRGDTRLRARPGHRGELDRRQGQGVHHDRRARARPPRRPPPTTPSRPTSAACAGHRLLVPLLGRAAPDSPAGRTRTAPAADAAVTGLRFGVVSCANWEAGYFSAYRHLAARERPGRLAAPRRLHLRVRHRRVRHPRHRRTAARRPPHEIVTLADYRTRHGRYKTDPDLQALHATAPVVAIWDDHEFANDAWSGGAENHTEGAEGAWAARQAAAQAGLLRVDAGARPAIGRHHLPAAALRQARRPLPARPALLPRRSRSSVGERLRSTTRTVRSPAAPSSTG